MCFFEKPKWDGMITLRNLIYPVLLLITMSVSVFAG